MTTESARALFEALAYDPRTGLLTWKKYIGQKAQAGKVAGTVMRDGRRRISFRGKDYMASRLAWLLAHRQWPVGVIDHIDGDNSNNRLRNLRDVTIAVNTQNRRKPMLSNKSGYLGVSWDKTRGKWRASIRPSGGLPIILGSFDDPTKAHAAYVRAKRKYHPGCTI
jgi:hypothetical protein